MARFDFLLPDIGEGLAEVELVKWLVAVGDTVRENDPLADVESDKAIVTMPAPASGRITEFCVSEGERLKVGGLMLVMDIAGNDIVGASGPHAAPEAPRAATVQTAGAPTEPSPAPPGPVAASMIQASPAVRKRARELGVALESVHGTGPGGRVTFEDVQGHSSAAVAPDDTIPFRGIRRRIAEAMELSARTIPHVTGFHEFDADALIRLHASLKPRAEALGVRFTLMPLVVRAATEALRAHPIINSTLDEAGHVIRLKKVYNIGIAAATPDGLMVPVLHHADRLGLLDLARAMDRLVAGAREGRLQPADLQQGTFTITNVGAARGWLNTSLIRLPEVAILGVGRVEERAVVRDGQVVARPVMPLALTFDHRVVDGEEGLGFMLTLRDLLEHPERLLESGNGW